MSLADRIMKAQNTQTKFIMSGGLRFGGKTSSLGTLPGKTLLGIVGDKESGAQGALKVAEECGNTIDVVSIKDAKDMVAICKEAFEAGYDNFAADGLSAITEVESEKDLVKKQMNSGGNAVFVAWRTIGNETIEMIQELKKLSVEYGRPVVLTMAFKDPKVDASGHIEALQPDVKGNMALSYIKGKCPFFVCARMVPGEDGEAMYVLQTEPDDQYPARLDGILAKDVPAGFRTQKEKLGKGELVGFAALLNFLENY